MFLEGYDFVKDRVGDVLEGDDYSKKPFALQALPLKMEEHLMTQTWAKN